MKSSIFAIEFVYFCCNQLPSLYSFHLRPTRGLIELKYQKKKKENMFFIQFRDTVFPRPPLSLSLSPSTTCESALLSVSFLHFHNCCFSLLGFALLYVAAVDCCCCYSCCCCWGVAVVPLSPAAFSGSNCQFISICRQFQATPRCEKCTLTPTHGWRRHLAGTGSERGG